MISRDGKKVVHLSVESGYLSDDEVYLIRDENGDVIYKKPDSQHDGIVIEYKDPTKQSGKNYVEYTIDQTTQNLKVVEGIYPYQILPPFSDVIKDKNDILSFTDTTQQISCLDEYCFFRCASLTSVNCPGAKKLSEHSLENAPLKGANLSALTAYYAGQITFNKLNSMYVNSETYKSIDNGFGDVDQLVINWQTSTLNSIVGNCKHLSCDDIKSANGYSLAFNYVLEEAYLWNLSNIADSIENFAYGDYSLKDLYIDNDIYKTIPSNPNDTHRNTLVSKDGHTLYGILNYGITCLSNDNITDLKSDSMYRNTSLLSIHIDNDVYTTNADDTAIYTKVMKTLVRVVKAKNVSPSILDSVETIEAYAFAVSQAFKNLTTLNLNSVKQIKQYAFYDAKAQAASLSVYADNIITLNSNCQFYSFSPVYISFNKLQQITGHTTFSQYTTALDTGIARINAPNLTRITGSNTFLKCGRLKDVEFPKLQQIGNSTFQECISLSSVSLPMCTTFGDNLFLNCLDADHNPTLKDLTITSVTKAQATEMKDRICIPVGCTCHCSDGDITF